MSEVLKICGIAMISGICSLLLKRSNPELSRIVSMLGLITALAIVLSQIQGVISSELFGDSLVSGPYGKLITKALGIGMTVKICSDVLKDCGEDRLSEAVESIGKGAILLLSIPALKELIGLCGEFFV